MSRKAITPAQARAILEELAGYTGGGIPPSTDQPQSRARYYAAQRVLREEADRRYREELYRRVLSRRIPRGDHQS